MSASWVAPIYTPGEKIADMAGIEIPAKMQGQDILAKDYKPKTAVFAARDRCGEAAEARFYGPCGACSAALKERYVATARDVEAPEYAGEMDGVVGMLRQIHGTTEMVELYGASMLALEMERVKLETMRDELLEIVSQSGFLPPSSRRS